MCIHTDTPQTKTIVHEFKISLAKYKKGNSLVPGTHRLIKKIEDISACVPSSMGFSKSVKDSLVI